MRKQVIFITGISSGIGRALAEHYLAKGHRVYGMSRRTPQQLMEDKNFTFRSIDLAELQHIPDSLNRLLDDQQNIDLVVLNSGMLGPFSDMSEQSHQEIQKVFDVNVWANKHLLDELLSGQRVVKQVVAISSGASVNGNRGWGAYAMSKAALNMLILLFAREHEDVHFTSLAPGLVDTPMVQYLCALPDDAKFLSLENIRGKQGTESMPKPAALAPRLAQAIAQLPAKYDSGAYCDIRDMA